MQERGTAVGANNEVRRLAKQIAARSVAPEVIGEEPEIFHDLEVGVDLTAAACGHEVLLRSERRRRVRIERPDGIEHASDFHMDVRTGVEGQFADDIGMHAGEADAIVGAAGIRIHFGGGVVWQSSREGRSSTTARSTEILVGIFGSDSPSYFVAGVIEEAEARNAAPSQAVQVVHVKLLPIKQVSRQGSDMVAAGSHHAPGLAT